MDQTYYPRSVYELGKTIDAAHCPISDGKGYKPAKFEYAEWPSSDGEDLQGLVDKNSVLGDIRCLARKLFPRLTDCFAVVFFVSHCCFDLGILWEISVKLKLLEHRTYLTL